MSGSRRCSLLCLQCSRRSKILSTRILDGSAHWNPSGTHSDLIQEAGSSHNFPHGMVALFFPEAWPDISVSHMATDDQMMTHGCGRSSNRGALCYVTVGTFARLEQRSLVQLTKQ